MSDSYQHQVYTTTVLPLVQVGMTFSQIIAIRPKTNLKYIEYSYIRARRRVRWLKKQRQRYGIIFGSKTIPYYCPQKYGEAFHVESLKYSYEDLSTTEREFYESRPEEPSEIVGRKNTSLQ